MTDTHLRTYRITDDSAIIYERPAGVRRRGTAMDELFQGRPAVGYPGWVVRIGDDGVTPQGYIKASLCDPFDMPAGVRTIQDLPPPSALGDAVDHLASWLAFGRSLERARSIRALFGDFAAAVIDRAASQAASVMTTLLERQEKDRAELAKLEQRIVALEGLRERAVGG